MHKKKSQRWKVLVTVGVTGLLTAGALGIASADEGDSVGAISCQSVDIASLGDVPESAVAEVERNLELLNTQISEANNRLQNSVGQGGANFVDNAILGPLVGKRESAINRIATAIGRQGERPNLDVASLAQCSVAEEASAPQPTQVNVSNGAEEGAEEQNEDGAAEEQNGSEEAVNVGAISCPSLDVADLGDIPASAADEVVRNLETLNNQINEANNRLENSVGQGGANFVQNAILGPLVGKRESAINRIATAIGRQGERPNLDVDALATCEVVENADEAEVQLTDVSAQVVE